MKTSIPEHCIQEPMFFKDAGALWKQLGYAMTEEVENESGPLRRVSAPSAFAFLLATADQIFTHELILSFLGRLRTWGKETLDAQHASTPQIHVYGKGCHREIAPDAVQVRWHYLYSLTRRETAAVQILQETRSQKRWFGISVARITSFQLRFNDLLVHETRQAYGLEDPSRAMSPLDGAILLHGYLW